MSWSIPVHLEPGPSLPGFVAAFARPLARFLHVADGQPVTLSFGSARGEATARVLSGLPSNRTMVLSPHLAKSLRLPLPLSVSLRRGSTRLQAAPGGPLGPLPAPAEGSSFDLGPLVGLLVRHVSPVHRDFLEGARLQHTEAFLFRITDLQWNQKLVWGYRREGDRWQRWAYPFPHVVYDQSPGGWVIEGKSGLFQRLERWGVPTFNGAVGYKWGIHRRLTRIPDLRPHLPATRPTRNPRVVLSWLSHCHGVYLKPSGGHRGKGIVRVRRVAPDRFHVSVADPNRERLLNRRQLVLFLTAALQRRLYLVQREIPLLRLNGALWDVRALLLRDATGEWKVAGMAARVNESGRIVSNLHQGGKPVPLPYVLETLFGGNTKRAARMAKELEDVALRVARAIQSFAPNAGELGVDLGIDEEGRVWLIEVNPKPGRQSFVALSPPEEALKFYALPFEYARFLAGFGPLSSPPW